MASSSRALLATSDLSVLFSPEFREALTNCTALRLTYQTTDAALRLLPASTKEVHDMAALTQRVGEILAGAKRAHITSTAGTDLTLSLGQYSRVTVYDGIGRPGKRQGVPGGEVLCIPNDGSAEGVLVIDGSIGANDFKELTESVHMKVEKGNVVAIAGGGEAERLRRFLADLNDPNIYHLTELGIGTNRRCRFIGVAAPAEDTHIWGTVSLALGTDTHLGGVVSASLHIDMTQRIPDLELDGEPIVRDGKLLIE